MYLRMILVTGVTLYTSRIVLRELGIVDYGIYNAVGGVVLFFSFLVPTLSQSVQRFLNYEMGRDDLQMVNKTFSMSIQIHLFISFLIVLLSETIGLWFLNAKMVIPEDRVFAANIVYQCSIISLVAIFCGIPYNALIIAKQKMKIYAYFSIITASLKLLTAYALINATIDKLVLYAIFLLVIFVIARINVSLYCRFKFKDIRYYKIKDWTLFKKMLNFSGWTLYGSIGNMAYSYGLNIMLNIFCGPAVNAARAISTQIQHAVDQFSSSFQSAINPQLVQSYSAKDFEYVNKLFISSMKFSLFLMAFFGIPVYVEMETILNFWLGRYPTYSVEFSKIVILICVLQSLFNSCNTLNGATGQIKIFQLLQGSTLVAILPLSFILLLNNYSPVTVLLFSFVLILISKICCVFVLKKTVPFIRLNNYFFELSKILIICFIAFFLIDFLKEYLGDGIMRVFILSLLNIIILIFLGYTLSLNEYEKIFLYKILRK